MRGSWSPAVKFFEFMRGFWSPAVRNFEFHTVARSLDSQLDWKLPALSMEY